MGRIRIMHIHHPFCHAIEEVEERNNEAETGAFYSKVITKSGWNFAASTRQ
jgi:hypothetical protein